MASVNKVLLLGNVGNQPELRYTASNQAVTELRIATNEAWTDKEGQRQERTEWHTVVVWGRQAENCERFLGKGRQVFVEGRLQTREYTDKEGQKRYKTEIVANNVTFVGGGRGEAGGSGDAGPEAEGGSWGGGSGGRDGGSGGRDGGSPGRDGGGASRDTGGAPRSAAPRGGTGRDAGGGRDGAASRGGREGGGGGGGWGAGPGMDGGNIDDDIPW